MDDAAQNKRELLKRFFKMQVAGKNIEVECLYSRTRGFCYDYLVHFDMADFVVAVTTEEVYEEAVRAYGLEQKDVCSDSDIAVEYPDIEPVVVLRKVAHAMLDYGIVLVHGAAISINGACYVFMAPSGTGKTTHVRNWLKMIPESVVVNGDKPFVDVAAKTVYGTPWCGKEGLGANTSARLAGLVVLERGVSNTIEQIGFGQALPALLSQCYIPQDAQAARQAYALIGRFGDVPCYRLLCNMDSESAVVAYRGLCINGR